MAYIYPEWQASRGVLYTALTQRESLSRDEIWDIIDSFFRNHMFQIGVTTSIANDLAKTLNREEVEARARHHAAKILAARILEEGSFYMAESRRNLNGGVEVEYRVMLFGSAKAGIFPDTRERGVK